MAKRSTEKRGGKRAGAGRKPAGSSAKTVNYNARISAQTLAELKAAAKKTASGSVANLAGWLIEEGLRNRRKKLERDPSTNALCFLVAMLAATVTIDTPKEQKSLRWRDDPFVFEAFRRALEQVLSTIRPRGELVSPVDRLPQLKRTIVSGPLE